MTALIILSVVALAVVLLLIKPFAKAANDAMSPPSGGGTPGEVDDGGIKQDEVNT